jgi:hypothetical protein
VLQVQVHMVSSELSGPAAPETEQEKELTHTLKAMGVPLSQRAMEFVMSEFSEGGTSVKDEDVAAVCNTYRNVQTDFGNCVLPFRLMAKGFFFVEGTTKKGKYTRHGRIVKKIDVKNEIDTDFNEYIGVTKGEIINLCGHALQVCGVAASHLVLEPPGGAGDMCVEFHQDIETGMAAYASSKGAPQLLLLHWWRLLSEAVEEAAEETLQEADDSSGSGAPTAAATAAAAAAALVEVAE